MYVCLSLSLLTLETWFLIGQSLEERKRKVVLVGFQDQTLLRQLHQEEDQTEAQ